MRRLIAPSILSADFAKLGEEVAALERAGADWIHIDVMDGHFVPNITIGPGVIKAIRPYTSLPFDVHLMIEHPENYVKAFAEAGANWITVHMETSSHIHRILQQIKHFQCGAGVSINPGTPVSHLEAVLPEVDMVLVMTVNPGFGGQVFIESAAKKVEQLRNLIQKVGREILLEVDGGINTKTIGLAVWADVFVAGTAVFKGGDYEKNIKSLKEAALVFPK